MREKGRVFGLFCLCLCFVLCSAWPSTETCTVLSNDHTSYFALKSGYTIDTDAHTIHINLCHDQSKPFVSVCKQQQEKECTQFSTQLNTAAISTYNGVGNAEGFKFVFVGEDLTCGAKQSREVEVEMRCNPTQLSYTSCSTNHNNNLCENNHIKLCIQTHLACSTTANHKALHSALKTEDNNNNQQQVKTYQPHSIVHNLHSVPHYDSTFKSVSHVFKPENAKYLESLGMVGFPFYLLSALILFISLARCLFSQTARCFRCIFHSISRCFKRMCCFCCKKDQKFIYRSSLRIRKFEQVNGPFLVCLLVFVGVLGVAAVGCAIYSSLKVDGQISEVCDTINDVATQKDNNVNEADKIVDELHTISADSFGLRKGSDLQALIAADINYSNETALLLRVIEKECNSTSSDISDTTNSVSDFNLRKYTKQIRDFNKPRNIGQLAVLGVIFVPLLLLLIAAIRQSSVLMWNIVWISVGICFVAFILVGVGSGACIGVADFCADPDHFLLTEANKTSSTATTYLQYYLTCDTNSTNPFSNTASDLCDQIVPRATLAITQAYQALASIPQSEITAKNVTQQMKNVEQGLLRLNASLQSVGAEGSALLQSLDCPTLHNEYETQLDSLCNNGLFWLGSVVLCELVLAMLSLCGFWLAKKFLVLFDPINRKLSRGGAPNLMDDQNRKSSLRSTLLVDDLSLEAMEIRHGKTSKTDKSAKKT